MGRFEIGSEYWIRKYCHKFRYNYGIVFWCSIQKRTEQIKKHLKTLNIVHFDNDISELAVSMIESYSKSHGLQIPDAIIAATAR